MFFFFFLLLFPHLAQSSLLKLKMKTWSEHVFNLQLHITSLEPGPPRARVLSVWEHFYSLAWDDSYFALLSLEQMCFFVYSSILTWIDTVSFIKANINTWYWKTAVFLQPCSFFFTDYDSLAQFWTLNSISSFTKQRISVPKCLLTSALT